MFSRHIYINRVAIFAMVTMSVSVGFTNGQSASAPPGNNQQPVAVLQPKPSPETKATPQDATAGDLQTEVNSLKAENAAVREMLKKMEDKQKTLLEQVERLQKRLDAPATTNAQAADQSQATNKPPVADDPGPNVPPPYAVLGPPPGQPVAKQTSNESRYQDGIVIWKTADDSPVPFLMRFNNNTQLRYLNTLSSTDSFTDHLGNVHEVHRRNDITVNRSMFIISGYIFDKRALYSLTVWTSAGAASIVVAGNIGWRFSKRFTLMAGYTGVPGSRSLVNTFPYYTSTDRSMADNFFRPGFTQGVWAFGDITNSLHYLTFLGNSLNTLSITANKIDTNLMGSGSIWWEPLGGYSEQGKSVNMYDDYFAQKKARIRLGTSFTLSREDRFSNLDQSSPENTALYNSDGVLAFSTGAFAPGVTLDKATYKMWAMDGGVKYNGLAINGQYFMRWLNDFEADGPLPLSSTFDHGYELSASYFVVPRKLAIYGRSSQVFGQFGNSYEYGGGIKWHFVPTERLWLNAELFRINRAPYSGAFTPYTAGMTGWVPMIQTVIAF